MPFAHQLHESLQHRQSSVADEFAAGDSLEDVLSRHLLAVEAAADTDLLTSILLLDGNSLSHCAAPSLPKSYCEAIDGVEIGPNVGSCGTAAYSKLPVYVTDIATDPLWTDYRELALQHGLRACWSTPIFDDGNKAIGTFAIYHLTPRGPTADEVDAITMITDHVADAIMWSRGQSTILSPANLPDLSRATIEGVEAQSRAELYGFASEEVFRDRFLAHAAKLDVYAAMVDSKALAAKLRATAESCRRLVGVIESKPFGDKPRKYLN